MSYKIVVRLANGKEEIEPIGDASPGALVRAYALDRELGAREWISGDVYQAGELVARLAYNGQPIE